MDREQQERFAQAVERKNEAAAARAGEQPAPSNLDEVAQESRTEPGRGQDVAQREKSSRHGQVTADKWNQ